MLLAKRHWGFNGCVQTLLRFKGTGLIDCQSQLTVVYGQTQLFTFFELLFEELFVSSNFSAGVGDGSGAKVGQFGLLSIVSEQIRALKKVLADWALI